jgi:hypothetical protein
MVTRKMLIEFLASLDTDELRAAELLAGCYACKLFISCDTAHAFFAEPKKVAEHLDSHLQQSAR